MYIYTYVYTHIYIIYIACGILYVLCILFTVFSFYFSNLIISNGMSSSLQIL